MRASRLVSILLLLQTRGQMTAPQLAAELEVSVRTIYRDVESLSEAGVPVYGDVGPAGGYRLLGGYRTRLTGLTAAEAEALQFIGMPGAAAELGLGTVLAAAQLKLHAALPEGLRERSARIQERFFLDAPGWYHDGDSSPHLDAIADAVWNQLRIEVRYSIGNLDRWLARIGDDFPRLGGLKLRSANSRGSSARSRGASTAGARSSTPPAARSPPSAARSARSRSASRRRSAGCSARPRSKRILRYPELHDGRAPLRPADRQGPPRRDPGLGPPHQRQQRDGLHRAPGDRRAVGAALVPPRPRGQGDPPDPPLAQRPGRPGGRVAARHAGDAGRARPDPRAGPLQPRLPDVAPRLQPGGPARAPRRPASPARSPLPRRSGPRPAARAAPAPLEPDGDRRPPSPRAAPPPHRPSRGRWCRSTCTWGFGSTSWSSPGRTPAARRWR